jgi:hypothetical protein
LDLGLAHTYEQKTAIIARTKGYLQQCPLRESKVREPSHDFIPPTTDTAATSPIPNSVPIVSLPEEDVPCESDMIHIQKAPPGELFDIK